MKRFHGRFIKITLWNSEYFKTTIPWSCFNLSAICRLVYYIFICEVMRFNLCIRSFKYLFLDYTINKPLWILFLTQTYSNSYFLPENCYNGGFKDFWCTNPNKTPDLLKKGQDIHISRLEISLKPHKYFTGFLTLFRSQLPTAIENAVGGDERCALDTVRLTDLILILLFEGNMQ